MNPFDFLSKPLVADPEQNKALMTGLMQAGMSLLASRGNLGNALGQAGMQGMQGAQQYRDNRFQQQLRQGQLEELKRQQAMRALPAQFLKPGMRPPTMDDRDVGRPGEQAIPAQQFDYGGYADALAQYDPNASIQMRAALQKDETPIAVGDGGMLVTRSGRVIAENRKEAKDPDDIAALKVIYEGNPAGYRAALERLGTKKTTHQPAASLNNYGTPLPIDLGGGRTGYIQPPTRPGGPSQIVQVPGTGDPAIKPADRKDLTESQAKATAFLGQMQSATKELSAVGADQSALSLQAETALAGGAGNIVIRQKAQQIRQAQDQWSEAFLRFKTGAASTPAEVKSNRETFFPKIGDGPDVIAQKKRMRAQAEADMSVAAGRGTSQLPNRASVVDFSSLK